VLRRQQRLLILGYHGVARCDEHEWDPQLYIAPERLRQRMQLLAQERCNVLPLGEAVVRLQSGTLSPRAVTITFDDGYHDFYSVGFPVSESFGYPVTLGADALAELDDNRRVLETLTTQRPQHCCYASGSYLPEHLAHLAAYGIALRPPVAADCARHAPIRSCFLDWSIRWPFRTSNSARGWQARHRCFAARRRWVKANGCRI